MCVGVGEEFREYGKPTIHRILQNLHIGFCQIYAVSADSNKLNITFERLYVPNTFTKCHKCENMSRETAMESHKEKK